MPLQPVAQRNLSLVHVSLRLLHPTHASQSRPQTLGPVHLQSAQHPASLPLEAPALSLNTPPEPLPIEAHIPEDSTHQQQSSDCFPPVAGQCPRFFVQPSISARRPDFAAIPAGT